MPNWVRAGPAMAVAGFGCPSPTRRDAVALTDLTPLLVAGGGVDLEEVVFGAARDCDQQQPCGRAGCPEPVGAAAGQEHDAARRGGERIAAAANR